MSFICPRCSYSTNKKSSFKDHLNRINPCKSINVNTPVKSVDNIYTDNKVTCSFCNRQFTSARYHKMHVDKCEYVFNNTLQLKEIRETLNKQALEIQELKNMPRNNTINILINLNNFGFEDRSYITHEIMKLCIENMQICPLIDHLYFNPEHPENHTFRLKSEKRERVVISRNSEWIEADLKATIDSIILKENDILSKLFYEHVWTDPCIGFDNKAYVQSKLLKINEKDKSYFEQRRQIQAKLKMFTGSLILK